MDSELEIKFYYLVVVVWNSWGIYIFLDKPYVNFR